MRRILFFVLFFCSPTFAFAIDNPLQAEKPKVGQAVEDFNNAAASSAKTGLYFMAALLVAFGIWKKYGENKAPGQKKLISILSRTTLGPRAGLLVAEVEGERFLLSHTSDSISLISKLNSAGFDQVLDEELEDEVA